MKFDTRIARFILAGTLFVTGGASAASWERIDLGTLVDIYGQLKARNGQVLTDRAGNSLVPSCALGPAAQGIFGPFRFFFQEGSEKNRDKLLIFHDGGGACWEANTCASPFVTAQGTYDPTISETAQSLALPSKDGGPGGVLDDDDTKNPFKGWTKIFIPYCTGDVGWGNNDVSYTDLPFPIHHRGYANIRAVLRWVENYYAAGQPKPSKVAVAGVSAGAYASPVTVFPAVKELFPQAKTYVIADSGNGVVTDSFLGQAKYNWGLENTLPDYLVRVLEQGADGLPVRIYGELATRFPGTRFGQYQNAYDSIQTVVYNTMKYTLYPELWRDLGALVPSLVEWTAGARLATNLSAWAPNYRYYTAAGTEHTVLVEIPPKAGTGFCSDHFYTENSAGGLSFRTWVNDMIKDGGFLWATGNWRNATCFPNCIRLPEQGCEPVVKP